jgi:hypothetical protein
LSSSLNPAAAGTTVTFTATVSSTTGTPTGNVNFNDGATTIGMGALNAAGTATFATSTLAIGSHSMTAVYGGDASHTASTSTVLNQVITGQATTTSLSSSLNPAAVGAAVTFTAKVTSTTGTPTGSVTFKDGATTLGTGVLDATASATLATNTLAAGSHSIIAIYSGDSSYATSTSTVLTQVVLGSGANVTASANPNPSTFGQPVSLSVSVKSSSPPTPTGTLTFNDTTKGFTIGTVTLDANGNGSLVTGATTLRGGPHSITAAYGGDKNYGTSSSIFTQTVNKAPTSTAISSSANPSTSGASVTFTATVTWSGTEIPQGNVQFEDGTTVIATVALNAAGVATFTTTTLTVGTHSILAHYRGTASYASSNSALLSQTVN